MGSNLVGSLIKWTADKLSNFLQTPQSGSSSESSTDALEDLHRLQRTMMRIQSVLLGAADRHIRDHSEKYRLEELKEVAYDAEDLVEEYAYEVLHAKMQVKSRAGKEINNMDLSSINVSVPVPEEMAMRMKVIRKRFDEIIEEWEKLRWMENDGVRQHSLDMVRKLPTSSIPLEPSIYGRNQDKDNVIALLLDGNNCNKDKNLCVLPIVGMGGVGKTALAQFVYNDEELNSYFDLKAWVCVSKEFDVEKLTSAVISSLTKTPCNFLQLDDLQRALMEKVTGQRFLLVLDDVWNENVALWHLLQAPLYYSCWCTILVTARNEKVAKIMQTIPFYTLRCLEQENSWKLFKQVAFGGQDLAENNNLLEIGRKITEKCQGLPLAIKAIGCALHFELEEDVWRDAMESELWEIDVGMNEVIPALRLSYDRMPVHLKQCFVSLSLFPKDYVFFKENTIQFWSALGFLNPEGRQSTEDVGSRFFDDIQQRSMLQKVQYDKKICAFVMHDLVQSLAEFVAGEAFRRSDFEILESIPNRSRYLSVLVNSLPKLVELTYVQRSSSLRSLQVFNTVNPWLGKHISVNLNEELFHNLRMLRVLNFSNTGIRILPDSIGNLKLLRFLGLSRTKIEVLPDSICFFYNLQTLDLSECPLQELPKGITNLVNLQHLIVEKWSRIQLPHGIGQLTNLQTLNVYNIRRGSGCEIAELSKLNKLCGELRITGLNNIQQQYVHLVLVNLLNKKNIRTLILDWCSHEVSKGGKDSLRKVSGGNHELVLEALQPQLKLEVLELYNYPGLSYPRWLGDPSYSRLVEVVLFGNNERGPKYLPTLGHLPSLKILSIQGMLTIECVGYEFRGNDAGFKSFPSLNLLEFKNMPKWEHWVGIERNDFSSLDTLKIVHCRALRSMPNHLSCSLRKLVVNSCRGLSHLPTVLPSLANLILMGAISNLMVSNLKYPSLKSLEIGFSKTIKIIRLQRMNLPSLEELVVKNCTKLKNICGFHDLSFLRELKLDGLPNVQLYESTPLSLQVLKVSNCRYIYKWELDQRHKEQDFYWDDVHEILQTASSNNKESNGMPQAVPIRGDDYNLDWLLSVSQKSREYSDKDESPSHGRERLRIALEKATNALEKATNAITVKGKGLLLNEKGYSSGSSIEGGSDSELGSFGGTSEEDFELEE